MSGRGISLGGQEWVRGPGRIVSAGVGTSWTGRYYGWTFTTVGTCSGRGWGCHDCWERLRMASGQ